MNEKSLVLFTDASFNPQQKRGVGGYVCLSHTQWAAEAAVTDHEVRLKTFDATTNSRVELQAIEWALREVTAGGIPGKTDVLLYTDSQTAAGLPRRWSRIQQRNLQSKQGRTLSQADLYRSLMELFQQWQVECIWLKGHRRSRERSKQEQYFSVVDRAVRGALRRMLNH